MSILIAVSFNFADFANFAKFEIAKFNRFLKIALKRVRKIRNKYLNCAHMNLTITKITINSCSNFRCERPFYVIFVIVIFNWQIWCGFLIVNGLVFRKNGTRCTFIVQPTMSCKCDHLNYKKKYINRVNAIYCVIFLRTAHRHFILESF